MGDVVSLAEYKAKKEAEKETSALNALIAKTCIDELGNAIEYKAEKEAPDAFVDDHGNFHTIMLLTQNAVNWVDEYVLAPEWFANGALIVEHRYTGTIVRMMKESGLVVK